jgi:hypothetical protein
MDTKEAGPNWVGFSSYKAFPYAEELSCKEFLDKSRDETTLCQACEALGGNAHDLAHVRWL